MNLKLILYLILLISIQNSIFALNLDVDGSINEYSLVYDENVNVNINCGEDITLKVPYEAYDISFNNILTKNKSFLINNCNLSHKLSYKLKNIEDLGNNKFRFERNFNEYLDIEYKYILNVPLEYSLNKNNSMPKEYILTYGENYKYLTFNSSDIFVLYFQSNDLEKNNINIYHIFDELKEFNVIFLLIFSFLLGGGITYIIMNRKLKIQPQISVPSYVVSKEERLVLDVVKENLGINQKQIANKLNFSKSRISSLVSNLEEKKLIKREKFGRSYKVYLDKKII